MKKKIIGTVIFLALAAALLWKLNDVFRLKQEDGVIPMELFYEATSEIVPEALVNTCLPPIAVI